MILFKKFQRPFFFSRTNMDFFVNIFLRIQLDFLELSFKDRCGKYIFVGQILFLRIKWICSFIFWELFFRRIKEYMNPDFLKICLRTKRYINVEDFFKIYFQGLNIFLMTKRYVKVTFVLNPSVQG